MNRSVKHILKVICTGLVLSFVMGIAGCGSFGAGYQKISELERIAGIENARYDVRFSSFDGSKLKNITHSSFSYTKEETAMQKKEVQNFLSLKGKKVEDWTKDKITFPVYALTILPVTFTEGRYVPGETVVWSNGYLITTSGDVYKCNPDFKPFMKEDEGSHITEGEFKSISSIKIFRPLAYAGKKWNKDLLRTASTDEKEILSGIEMTFDGMTGDDDYQFVNVTLKNKSQNDWHYAIAGVAVRVEVKVDGQWYFINYAPNVDITYVNVLDFKEVVRAGSENHLQLGIGHYGKLPPGEYRIVISGGSVEERRFVSAEFEIKGQV